MGGVARRGCRNWEEGGVRGAEVWRSAVRVGGGSTVGTKEGLAGGVGGAGGRARAERMWAAEWRRRHV